MSIDFNAGCYLASQREKKELITGIYQICSNRGFEYRPGRGYPKSFDLQLQQIDKEEDDFLWIKKEDKSILLGLSRLKRVSLNDEKTGSFFMFSMSFNYSYITTKEPSVGQYYLEEVVRMLTEIHIFINADLTWAGYPEDTPNLEEYYRREVTNLFWFNIIGPRLQNGLDKEKLLNAPGWQIKELPNGSIVVRLSEHPHVYQKIGEVYLHEYLGLEYVS